MAAELQQRKLVSLQNPHFLIKGSAFEFELDDLQLSLCYRPDKRTALGVAVELASANPHLANEIVLEEADGSKNGVLEKPVTWLGHC